MNTTPTEEILFQNVGKSFASTGKIIDDLSFRIPEGQFVSILGPSGSGKTTILRLVAGLTEATSGKVSVPQARSRTGRGYVFQESHLMPWRSVIENVMLPLELVGNANKGAAEAALDLVGLLSSKNLMPHELSGGMKMRASLARALVSEPKLLLLDEPFSALDEFTRYRLGEELRRIWVEKKMTEKKITVLFVTHSVSEATFISDRVLVFGDKPLKMAADISISLGEQRPGSLRVDPRFSQELKKVYEAFHQVHKHA